MSTLRLRVDYMGVWLAGPALQGDRAPAIVAALTAAVLDGRVSSAYVRGSVGAGVVVDLRDHESGESAASERVCREACAALDLPLAVTYETEALERRSRGAP